MLTGLFVIALAVTCAPIAAAVVVSAASRREDADWTLNGAAAPGRLRGLARQILDFHSEVAEWSRPKNHARTRMGRRVPSRATLTNPIERTEKIRPGRTGRDTAAAR